MEDSQGRECTHRFLTPTLLSAVAAMLFLVGQMSQKLETLPDRQQEEGSK